MKTYTIARCTTETPDWSTVTELAVDQFLWLSPVNIQMSAKLCYDGSALYVQQTAHELHIRAEHHEPYSMVCEDSCMELFLCPVEHDPRFFNFEFNPNGCSFIGIETSCNDIVRLVPLQEQALFQPQVRRFEHGWELEYRVPHSFVQMFFPEYRPETGKRLRANCYKSGDLTLQPHYIAWSPIHSSAPDFHQSHDFGLMTFA